MTSHPRGKAAQAFRNFLWCKYFVHRRKCPYMPERVANPPIPVAPKHIDRRQSRRGAALNRTLVCLIHVLYGNLEYAGRSAQCFRRRQQLPFNLVSPLSRLLRGNLRRWRTVQYCRAKSSNMEVHSHTAASRTTKCGTMTPGIGTDPSTAIRIAVLSLYARWCEGPGMTGRVEETPVLRAPFENRLHRLGGQPVFLLGTDLA